VSLIQIAPGQAFFAQIHIAVMIGVVFSMPVIVREIGTFVSSALYAKERKTIKNVALPAIALFASGCLFSYFVVVPYTLDFLYRFGEPMGIEAFLNITEFISFVMQFTIAFGLSYQLPIVMWASTKSGIVEPRFWRKNMRYAIIAIIIFGAAITPDGSGVTMWFVSGPMIALYFLGMLIVEKKITEKTMPTIQDEPTTIS
jgi:sec-independent protein translocase protein TatC